MCVCAFVCLLTTRNMRSHAFRFPSTPESKRAMDCVKKSHGLCQKDPYTNESYQQQRQRAMKKLQDIATHYCNTLQQTARHCNTLLQHTATHCNKLQSTAIHCNTLRHTATYRNILNNALTHCNTLRQCCSVLRRVAIVACCSVLRRVATSNVVYTSEWMHTPTNIH